MDNDKEKRLSIEQDLNKNCYIAEHNTSNSYEIIELYKPYEMAVFEVESRLKSITKELEIHFQRNPVYDVKSRLKTPSSIIDKLIRRGLEPNLISAKKNLKDIAGVKVICDYINDVYLIEELLCTNNDILIFRKSDYIKTPKANGYRSLHLVLLVPITISNRTEFIPVELQIRTVAMDFWASLEHQICYKKGCDNVPDTIISRLKDCAEIVANVDFEMQSINMDLEMKCSKGKE